MVNDHSKSDKKPIAAILWVLFYVDNPLLH